MNNMRQNGEYYDRSQAGRGQQGWREQQEWLEQLDWQGWRNHQSWDDQQERQGWQEQQDQQEYSRYSDTSRYASRQGQPTKTFARALTIVIVLIAIFIVGSMVPWRELVSALGAEPRSQADASEGSRPLAYGAQPGTQPGTQAIHSSQGTNLSGAPAFTKEVKLSDITDTQYLALINHEYAVKSKPSNWQMMSAWPLVPAIDDSVMLHQTTLSAVENLINDAQKAGAGNFYISSGYRDYNEQAQLYKDTSDKSTVQKPNHSEHQTGLAADIVALSYTYNSAGESIEEKWLAQNSWRYGLIARYSEDKRDITRIAGEPWHFRYVGQPHAWYCWANDLCFEEYIQFLKNSGGYSVTLDGITYHVAYERPDKGMIHVPDDMSYTVSSDNTGGYIITAWE